MLTSQEEKRVIAGLDRERQIYLALLDLSKRQMAIIRQEENVEALLEVLGAKQVLINELETIETELSPFRKGWEEMRETLDGGVRERIEERIRTLQQLLAGLLELEDEGRTVLQSRQAGVSADIRRVGHSRQAHQAYAVPQGRTAHHGLIDNRG